MIKYCPKCEECFLKNLEIQWCEKHQKEYDLYLCDEYTPNEECKCGCRYWREGLLQMTNPPTLPEMKVYRCVMCQEVRLEHSKSGRIRIMEIK